MRKRFFLSGILFLSLLCAAGCGKSKNSRPENSAGHTEADEKGLNEHAGEKPGAHSEEGEIEISPEGIKMAGITCAKVSTGSIGVSIDLSGEVGFNEDRLVHVTPRFSGIAKEIRFRVGEYVNAGDVVSVIESNESMTLYSMKAPISGRIIEKHISPGEHVSQEQSIYIIADLSSVWVNLAVYSKDALTVKPGQKATISAIGSDNTTQGTIHYVTPVMDVQTRKIIARVVLPNGNNTWRPGTFVNAHVEVGDGEEGVIVEKDAIQVLNNKNVVFIQHEPGRFKPVEVTVGESDSRRIRILGGLETGTAYVDKGAFEIKAKVVTSSLGGHAGHGH
jgi:membrane fusion protein, heavy metal efflux system